MSTQNFESISIKFFRNCFVFITWLVSYDRPLRDLAKARKLKYFLLGNWNSDCVSTSLLGEFVNWFLFSIYKSWKTYTLSQRRDRRKRSYYGLWSYYDSVLKEMFKLVTKESKQENCDYCELFLTLINKMLQSFASEKGNPVRPFNPTIL